MTEPSRSPLTPAVFHILLALSHGPLHGYAIMRRVEEDSGLKMGPGTVYGSLERLTRASWVGEIAEQDDTDRRRGRVFQLTAVGADALEAEARRITRLSRLEAVRELIPGTGS